MLTAAISKARNPAATQKLLALAADAKRAPEQRQSLLRGVEIGLAPMRGGGGRPLTVGGGAATAGGAAIGGGGGGRFAPVPPLTFPREPAALKTLQADSASEIAALAKRIAARLTWPGKPEAQPEVPKLTAEEEQRFAAGRELYSSVCAGCHQPDGLGKEKIAPALVQSQFATGNAAVAMRIILEGKEGTTGLMPPQGQALSDDKIAAVLTYIRREWGHTAPPVAPADVKEVRGLTASRKTPWTEAELTRLLSTGPGGAPVVAAGQ
jgi:mono/diheme cytochrome c family protein